MQSFYLAVLLSLAVFACNSKTTVEDFPINSESIIPVEYGGRSSVKLGEISTIKRNIGIRVYDHNIIDGDIVSVIVNGREVISQVSLEGPVNAFRTNVELDYVGYNYILLYAHNEGNIGVNTCAIEIEDGLNKTPYIMSADLRTNGAFDIYVTP